MPAFLPSNEQQQSAVSLRFRAAAVSWNTVKKGDILN
jgi:hypothetical protein